MCYFAAENEIKTRVITKEAKEIVAYTYLYYRKENDYGKC